MVSVGRREEENSLDLNNLPDEWSVQYTDGKQVLEESSTGPADQTMDGSWCRKKKRGGSESKNEVEKVYKCRFCSLKFFKSQALGGHMNRHRQEREAETLNRARHLVLSNEGLGSQGLHLGFNPQSIPTVHFDQRVIIDSHLPFRSVYPNFPSPSSSSNLSPPAPPLQPYIYASSSRFVPVLSSYPPVNDYFISQVLPGKSYHQPVNCTTLSNYTCIGAPVAHGFPMDSVQRLAASEDRDRSRHNNEDRQNCDRRYPDSEGSEVSTIYRFRDQFND